MFYLQAIPRRHLLTIGKVLVSAAAIIFIISRFDLPFFLSHWHKLTALPVAVSLAVLAIETTVVAGMRLKLVLRSLGTDYPLVRTSQIALCGFFVEQVAFGFVGGDAALAAAPDEPSVSKGDRGPRHRPMPWSGRIAAPRTGRTTRLSGTSSELRPADHFSHGRNSYGRRRLGSPVLACRPHKISHPFRPRGNRQTVFCRGPKRRRPEMSGAHIH